METGGTKKNVGHKGDKKQPQDCTFHKGQALRLCWRK